MASHHPVLNSASAATVGNLFAQKYYTMLNSSPQTLFRFYKERSMFTHVTTHEEDSQFGEQTVVGQENINKLQVLHFQECAVELFAVDCQESQDGGVLILVIGSLSTKGGPPRKFVQTFYLAVQTEPAGYYVLNDIFRYLKTPTVDFTAPTSNLPAATNGPEEIHGLSSTVVSTQPTIVNTQPAAVAQPSTPKPAVIEKAESPLLASPLTPVTTATSTVQQEKAAEPAKQTTPTSSLGPVPIAHKESTPIQQETKAQVQSVIDSTPKPSPQLSADKSTVSAVPLPKAPQAPLASKSQTAPAVKSDRSSWASLVSNPAEKEGKFQPAQSKPTVVVATDTTSNKPVSTAKTTPNLPVTNTNISVEDQKSLKKFGSGKPVLKEGCSVYVSNIPFSVGEEDIRSYFKHLAPIKSIVMRALKGYCFIEYASSEVVHQVVQACKTTPIVIAERTLSVEERKLKTEREKKVGKTYFGASKKYVNNNGNAPDDTNGGAKDDGEKWQKFQKKSHKNQQ